MGRRTSLLPRRSLPLGVSRAAEVLLGVGVGDRMGIVAVGVGEEIGEARVGECGNFKKIPTHTKDHGDA